MKRKYNYCVYMRLSREEQNNEGDCHIRDNVQEREKKIEIANKVMEKFMEDLKTPFYRREIILKI